MVLRPRVVALALSCLTIPSGPVAADQPPGQVTHACSQEKAGIPYAGLALQLRTLVPQLGSDAHKVAVVLEIRNVTDASETLYFGPEPFIFATLDAKGGELSRTPLDVQLYSGSIELEPHEALTLRTAVDIDNPRSVAKFLVRSNDLYMDAERSKLALVESNKIGIEITQTPIPRSWRDVSGTEPAGPPSAGVALATVIHHEAVHQVDGFVPVVMEFRNVTSDDVAFRVYPPLFEAYVVDLHNKRCMTQKLWPQFFAKQPNRTLKPGNSIFMLDSVNVHSLPPGQYTLSIHTLMLRNIASDELLNLVAPSVSFQIVP